MVRRSSVAGWLAVVCLVASSAAPALELDGMDWDGLGDEYVAEVKKIEGVWTDARQWKSTFCNGFYNYKVKLQGDLTKVDFELTEKGTIEVKAEMVNLHGHVDGKYRGSASMCFTVGGWLGLGIDDARLRAEARFDEKLGEGLKGLRLTVKETQLGRFRMGSIVPEWFENFAQNLANGALKRIWASSAGEWLSAKISEFIRKQVPASRGGDEDEPVRHVVYLE